MIGKIKVTFLPIIAGWEISVQFGMLFITFIRWVSEWIDRHRQLSDFSYTHHGAIIFMVVPRNPSVRIIRRAIVHQSTSTTHMGIFLKFKPGTSRAVTLFKIKKKMHFIPPQNMVSSNDVAVFRQHGEVLSDRSTCTYVSLTSTSKYSISLHVIC